jgi:hypothetical protein
VKLSQRNSEAYRRQSVTELKANRIDELHRHSPQRKQRDSTTLKSAPAFTPGGASADRMAMTTIGASDYFGLPVSTIHV